ncbi:MAG: hypothetical protein KGJ40_00260 [candidate division NC10 bacterium]|nr:hypothetical protein [candidate division NC10 bacterium]
MMAEMEDILMVKVFSVKRKLLSEIAARPEDKHQDVIDFMGYLKARAEEGAKHGQD